MDDQIKYDVAIVGGGLAGLSLSIQLSKKGHKVVLFEKEKFPFHKVCGEYISMESWNFLESLGIPLHTMGLPLVTQLQLTAPGGQSLFTRLPLGGFGISRYLLDSSLAAIAKESGVLLLEETKVEAILFDKDFSIEYAPANKGPIQVLQAKLCCAAFGKRSNLDVKWERDFIKASNKKLDNHVGIKYHVQLEWKEDLIGLHNFKDGYCGISKIEGNRYCLCYMTRAENLKEYKGDIQKMEQQVLCKNPFLKKILNECSKLESFPISISQINFNKKNLVQNGVLMLGDAAGTIPPLCGNGMSMALHSSKIATQCIDAYLNEKIGRVEMENSYAKKWNAAFGKRLRFGRILQRFFGNPAVTNRFVSLFKTFPFLASFVIRQTHGKSF